MSEKEKILTNETEKKPERMFILVFGKGPNAKTIEFIGTPVDKVNGKAEKETTHREQENPDNKKD